MSLAARFTHRQASGFIFGVFLLAAMTAFSQDKPAPQTEPAPTQSAPSTDKAAPSSMDAPASEDTTLKLGAGDLIELNVYNVPELTTKTRVGNNGDVYLPLVDYVHIAGLTLEEAQAVIEKRYADGGFLKDPHITIFVDEYASQGASVLGEVTKPGIYPVIGDQKLLDLISAAGGFTDKSGSSVTVTHRSQPDKPVTVPLARNVSDNPESNVPVYPGDTVIVRKADIVYVVGDVGKPSGFLMNTESLTVLQAVALAGGTNRTAKLGGARILRKGPNGMTESDVHLKDMLEAKAPDIPMQPNDILFVPVSGAKIFGAHFAQFATQAAAAAAIVALP